MISNCRPSVPNMPIRGPRNLVTASVGAPAATLRQRSSQRNTSGSRNAVRISLSSDTSACAREVVRLLTLRSGLEVDASGDVSIGKAVRAIAIASNTLQLGRPGQEGTCRHVSFQIFMKYASPDKQSFTQDVRFQVCVSKQPLEVPDMHDVDIANLDPVQASQLLRPRMPIPVRRLPACSRPLPDTTVFVSSKNLHRHALHPQHSPCPCSRPIHRTWRQVSCGLVWGQSGGCAATTVLQLVAAAPT